MTFIEEFITELGAYFHEAQDSLSSFEFWAYPVFTVLAIWGLSIIIPKLFYQNKIRYSLKKPFYVNSSIIIASSLIAGLLISIACYLWTQNYYSNHIPPLKLSFLISILIPFVFIIYTFTTLSKKYDRAFLKEITGQPLSSNLRDNVVLKAKKIFNTLKLFLFIPLIGFLFLFFILQKDYNLISFVFDNSGSMNSPPANNSTGQNKKNIATVALKKTFDNLDSYNHIILTTIEPGQQNVNDAQNTIDEITQNRSISDLRGKYVFFDNPKQASHQFINQISAEEIYGSPITEIMWQNFLFTKEISYSFDYNNKMLFVITDGEDQIHNDYYFFCVIDEFNQLFNEDNIVFIDIEGNVETGNINNFFSNAMNCNYSVEDGSTADDYFIALDRMLKPFNNNWFFVYWILSICIVCELIIFFINPKKL